MEFPHLYTTLQQTIPKTTARPSDTQDKEANKPPPNHPDKPKNLTDKPSTNLTDNAPPTNPTDNKPSSNPPDNNPLNPTDVPQTNSPVNNPPNPPDNNPPNPTDNPPNPPDNNPSNPTDNPPNPPDNNPSNPAVNNPQNVPQQPPIAYKPHENVTIRKKNEQPQKPKTPSLKLDDTDETGKTQNPPINIEISNEELAKLGIGNVSKQIPKTPKNKDTKFKLIKKKITTTPKQLRQSKLGSNQTQKKVVPKPKKSSSQASLGTRKTRKRKAKNLRKAKEENSAVFNYLTSLSEKVTEEYNTDLCDLSIDWNHIHSHSPFIKPAIVLFSLGNEEFITLIDKLKANLHNKIFKTITDKILFKVPKKARSEILSRAETILNEVKCVQDMWNLISTFIEYRRVRDDTDNEIISLIDSMAQDQCEDKHYWIAGCPVLVQEHVDAIYEILRNCKRGEFEWK
jgi:hypothetical protein